MKMLYYLFILLKTYSIPKIKNSIAVTIVHLTNVFNLYWNTFYNTLVGNVFKGDSCLCAKSD